LAKPAVILFFGLRGKGTMKEIFMATALSLAILVVPGLAAEPLPEPLANGSRLGHTLCERYVNGPHAGTLRSLICNLAGRPAVLVYAREIDPTTSVLLGKLDAIAQTGKVVKMTSACVLLTGADEDDAPLRDVAKKEKLEATILAATPLQWDRPFFGNHDGTRRRNLQRDAIVTVIVLDRLKVQASFSFRKGELNEEAEKKILRAAGLLLPRGIPT
jgi:hypothetical protein